jgi:hypothetical protein
MLKYVGVSALLLALLVTIAAVPASAASPQDLVGTWHGLWKSPAGFTYEGEMMLAVDGGNNVTGSIHWTLRESPRPSDREKIGMSGVEHVKGVFLPDSGVVRMESTSLEDTNHILGLDKYRLILSDDARVLGGITWDHGSWSAQILLRRQ